MKVLGIDPGFGRCGVAVVEGTRNGKDVLVYSDCIETSSKDLFSDRLAAVADAVSRIINMYAPDSIAIEKLFFNNNQKTAMQVAEVRGALINIATLAGVPLAEYTPIQVKSAVTGDGRADKRQIARMIHMLVSTTKKISYDDEYDAIAIGITHLACANVRPTS